MFLARTYYVYQQLRAHSVEGRKVKAAISWSLRSGGCDHLTKGRGLLAVGSPKKKVQSDRVRAY